MMADRVASTELLILDIDGIQMPTSQSPDVRTVAEKIVAQLPECFQDVSYIAQASASLGFKKAIVPSFGVKEKLKNVDMELHPVKNVKEAFKILFQ